MGAHTGATAGGAPRGAGDLQLVHLFHKVRAKVQSIFCALLPSPHFDAGFYKASYSDLAELSDSEAKKHYKLHGRGEGRRANPRHLLKIDERSRSSFDPIFYRNLYRPDWSLKERELKRDWKLHKSERRFKNWSEMLTRHEFKIGPWIDFLNLAEFEALNTHWAGRVQNKEQAVLAFVRDGWRRLAPLHLGGDFDAEYYRARYPQLADLKDEYLYKDWLLHRSLLGATPSPRKQLARLGLNLADYPTTFPWAAYAATYPGARLEKWSVLEDFVDRGFVQFGFAAESSADVPFLIALAESYARKGNDQTAIRAFEAAHRLLPLDSEARQHLGDSYLRLGLWGAAARSYAPLLEMGSVALWTVLNAASCALKLNDPVKALEVLARGRPDFSGDQNWLRKLDDAIEAAFNQEALRARNFYDQDRVADGDRCLLKAVERTVNNLTALAPLGTSIPASADGRIVILANQDLRQCTHYRVEQKAEVLDHLGRNYAIFSPAETAEFRRALAGASAAIFYRVPALPGIVAAIINARELNIPTYYEIDDLIFDSSIYPPPIETYGGQVSKATYDGLRFGTPLFMAAMSLCDYGIASTQPLVTRMVPIVRTNKCFVLKNGLDSRNQKMLSHQVGTRNDKDIRIFYGSGTLAHNSDFLTVAGPAILDILKRRPFVKLVIAGHLVLDDSFDSVNDQIIRHGFVPNSNTYWSYLSAADINLAVLLPDVMTDCKSEIKWLEAAVFGIPSVVSPTASYRAVLEDEEDVLMAAAPEDWGLALTRLIENPDLRQSIGAKARAKAFALYGLEAGAKALQLALAPADELRLSKPKLKPRLLIVNVYFPPQTIGGATRVVRDNVDSWIASGFSEQFDIAIVASDYGAEPAYATRVDSYRGIPVFRIAQPRQVNMDWRPLDPKMGELFKDVLAIWQPDLVHFHATQQLTASCVEQCQAASVPYIVTVHDAWWISDWQFLIDHEGRLHGPADPLLDPTSTGITPKQSLDRRARLANALHKADAVLAVSSAFADIYHKAGITETVAVSNGTPRIKRLPRQPSVGGRVRLGHMGGMTAHKGYPLIYAALQQGGFDNLELTIVDHERSSGEEHQMWGTTPVRIIPRRQQAAVPRLYAEMDILLAPSIWPESYGLVAREALACGLWVVASNLGAMGEDIVPDINGFVIDVSSPADLQAILRRISDDPDRYRNPPALSNVARSTDDQAADLVKIYRRIVDEGASGLYRAAGAKAGKDRITESDVAEA